MRFNLNKKVEEWVKNDVINQSDADNILKYENEYRPSYVLHTILGIACLAIVVGIISIIAANWHKVPAYLKLTSNFSAHVAILSSIYYFYKKENKKVTDLLIGIEFGMVIGTIALIGQIYHLDGHLFNSTSFWIVVTTPLVLFSSFHYIPYAWTILLVFVYFQGIHFIYQDFVKADYAFARSSLCISFILYWLSCMFQRYKKDHFHIATQKIGLFLFASIITFVTSLAWYAQNDFLQYKEFLVATILLALPTIIYLFKRNMKDVAIIVSMGTVFFLLPQYIQHEEQKIIAGATFLIFWISIARFAYKRQIKNIFDAASFLIAVRIIAIYFEVFGSLLQTGIGLITAGILTIVVMYLWQKQRNKAWNSRGDVNA